MTRRQKMVSKTVGSSVVTGISEVARMPSGSLRYSYTLQCACGNVYVLSRNAIGGASEPCPVCRKNTAPSNATDHPLYGVWQSMISRCYQPNVEGYKTYGARGITVCDAWLGTKRKKSGGDGFQVFLRDVGERPSPRHSLDRKDNSKGYSPDNVRWATPMEQATNRSTTKLVTIGEKTQSFSAWLRELGVPSSVAFRTMRRKHVDHTQFVQTAITLRKV